MHIFRDRRTRLWAAGWDSGITTTDHHCSAWMSWCVMTAGIHHQPVSHSTKNALTLSGNFMAITSEQDHITGGLGRMTTDRYCSASGVIKGHIFWATKSNTREDPTWTSPSINNALSLSTNTTWPSSRTRMMVETLVPYHLPG
jgi:hypothetical protein